LESAILPYSRKWVKRIENGTPLRVAVLFSWLYCLKYLSLHKFEEIDRIEIGRIKEEAEYLGKTMYYI
jgi:hypothetical protein